MKYSDLLFGYVVIITFIMAVRVALYILIKFNASSTLNPFKLLI